MRLILLHASLLEKKVHDPENAEKAMGLPTSKLGDECSEQRFASAEVTLFQEPERSAGKLRRSRYELGFMLRGVFTYTVTAIACTLLVGGVERFIRTLR